MALLGKVLLKPQGFDRTLTGFGQTEEEVEVAQVSFCPPRLQTNGGQA